MADPYLPALDAFVFSGDEAAVVTEALKSPSPWDFVPSTEGGKTALKSVKAKILDYHLERHSWNCCYCRTNLKGSGPFMTDREHILPKSDAAYKAFSYAVWNLAAACKRCNMQFKKVADDFVVDKTDARKFQYSGNYRFVHPNFDRWSDHLTRHVVQVGEENIVKYTRKSGCDKAAYAYKFFALNELQVDSFDKAQGLGGLPEVSELVAVIRKLAAEFGQ